MNMALKPSSLQYMPDSVVVLHPFLVQINILCFYQRASFCQYLTENKGSKKERFSFYQFPTKRRESEGGVLALASVAVLT